MRLVDYYTVKCILNSGGKGPMKFNERLFVTVEVLLDYQFIHF